MRTCNRPFLLLHTLALTMMVVQGAVREAEALATHKPKALQQTGPFSASTSPAWTAAKKGRMPFQHVYRKTTNHFRPPSQQHTTSQEESTKNPTEMNMVQRSMGIQKFRQGALTSSTARGFLIVSVLTVAALLQPKAVTALLQYPVWFLSNVLYKPYQNSLVTNPLITKVLTGAVLAVAGDAVAQSTTTEEDRIGYDKYRALSFAVFDSCYRFFQHNVFPIVIRLGQGNVVESLLPKILPSNFVGFLLPAAAAIEQTAMYQFVIVPFLYYPMFFAFTGYIQGLTVSQSLSRMKRQFFPCWKRNLMFWIPTQMVLFGIIAEKWQIPFACLMGMLWSMILSKTAGNGKKT